MPWDSRRTLVLLPLASLERVYAGVMWIYKNELGSYEFVDNSWSGSVCVSVQDDVKPCIGYRYGQMRNCVFDCDPTRI